MGQPGQERVTKLNGVDIEIFLDSGQNMHLRVVKCSRRRHVYFQVGMMSLDLWNNRVSPGYSALNFLPISCVIECFLHWAINMCRRVGLVALKAGTSMPGECGAVGIVEQRGSHGHLALNWLHTSWVIYFFGFLKKKVFLRMVEWYRSMHVHILDDMMSLEPWNSIVSPRYLASNYSLISYVVKCFSILEENVCLGVVKCFRSMHIHTAGEYCVAGFVEHRITSLECSELNWLHTSCVIECFLGFLTKMFVSAWLNVLEAGTSISRLVWCRWNCGTSWRDTWIFGVVLIAHILCNRTFLKFRRKYVTPHGWIFPKQAHPYQASVVPLELWNNVEGATHAIRVELLAHSMCDRMFFWY